jgi:hypothetical protein
MCTKSFPICGKDLTGGRKAFHKIYLMKTQYPKTLSEASAQAKRKVFAKNTKDPKNRSGIFQHSEQLGPRDRAVLSLPELQESEQVHFTPC